MKSIIFIESNTSGTGEIFIKKAIEYKYKPILLTMNSNLYSFSNKIIDLKIVDGIDTLNEQEIVNFCKTYIAGGNIISGITSSSEYYIEIAAKIARIFGLAGPKPEAIPRCRNKHLQYKTLVNHNLNLPKTKIISKESDILNGLKNMKFPVVIKPVEGTGSVGVRLCYNIDQCCSLVEQLLTHKKNERGIEVDNRVLLEEYISGDEYSGEVFDGELIGITKKYLSKPPFFIESGHEFPAILDHKHYSQIKREISRAIKVLGLEWGACHVEFRLFEDRVYFIEVNPRLAGGYIPEIVKLSTGIDLIDNQLKKALNMKVSIKKNKNVNIGLRFLIPSHEGDLLNFSNMFQADGIIEVKQYKTEGFHFLPRGDFRDRVGHIIFNMDIISAKEIEQSISRIKIIKE